MSENLEFIRQEYESWLAEKGIASKNPTVRFLEASTKDLSRPGADLLPDQTNDLGDFSIMAPYTQYVADHINRISGAHAGHPDRILDIGAIQN